MWLWLSVFASFSIISVSTEAPDNATFNYFTYGSNLLQNRIKINIPSAKFIGRGILAGYRLDFGLFNDDWQGAVATIVPQEDAIVWGGLYTISMKDLPKLDRQEGVDKHWYKRITVPILYGKDESQNLTVVTYIETKLPPFEQPPLPPARQPSRTYLKVIHLGAIEKGLPVFYLDKLYKFNDNGKLATCDKRKSLGYPFYDGSVCNN